MDIRINRLYLFILLAISTIFLPVQSHQSKSHHNICKNVTDYTGCIKANNVNIIPEFRSYGPLILNWSEWKSKNDNHIVPTYFVGDKIIYLAINCKKKLINVNTDNLNWKNWKSPIYKFEKDILDDFCVP